MREDWRPVSADAAAGAAWSEWMTTTTSTWAATATFTKRDDDGDWFRHDRGDDWDKIDDDQVARARQDLENKAAERRTNVQKRAEQSQGRVADRDGRQLSAQQRESLQGRAAERPRQGSGDVIGGLERDARARDRGAARTQHRQTWQRTRRSRDYSSRSYSSRRAYGGARGRLGGLRRR